MIDPHTHLRDWVQHKKETLEHGLEVAHLAGLDAVFEMPNTDPALTSYKTLVRRNKKQERAIKKLKKKYPGADFFLGMHAGVTADPKQIEEVVRAQKKLPWVIALKYFTTHSTGNMGILTEEGQRMIFRTLAKLGYKDTIIGHFEDEDSLKPDLWDPYHPFTHTLARPSECEPASLTKQIKYASEEGFEGTLHMAHVSVPESVYIIEDCREKVGFRLTCETAPHYCVLWDELMKRIDGLEHKMNPALRPKKMQEEMFNLVLEERVDSIGSDHAPHTREDKTTGKYIDGKWEGYASGIPVIPYMPRFIKLLIKEGMSKEAIHRLTHKNILEIFNLPKDLILDTYRAGEQSEELIQKLEKKYEIDAFSVLK